MSLLLLFPSSGAAPVVLIDTHDNWKDEKKRKKNWDEEQRAREERLAGIVNAYEALIEGNNPVAIALSEEFPSTFTAPAPEGIPPRPQVDFNAMLARVDAVEKLWAAFIEMDDEDIVMLMQ